MEKEILYKTKIDNKNYKLLSECVLEKSRRGGKTIYFTFLLDEKVLWEFGDYEDLSNMSLSDSSQKRKIEVFVADIKENFPSFYMKYLTELNISMYDYSSSERN